MRTLFLSLLFTWTTMFHAAGQTKESSPTSIRIMCIGDSITEGGKSFEVYRPLLRKKLGFDVIFVGSKGGDLKHEGYGGRNVAFLAETVPANFARFPADAILIHAGHNNFAKDKPVPGIITNTRKLIEGCRKANPNVSVFLGQVITSKKLPKYSYIPGLNSSLAKLVTELNSDKSRVILVDHASGFDPDTMTVPDKVHPNARGAEHMAQRWAAAIKQFYDK